MNTPLEILEFFRNKKTNKASIFIPDDVVDLISAHILVHRNYATMKTLVRVDKSFRRVVLQHLNRILGTFEIEQKKVFARVVFTSQNLVVCGGAGTGKSFIMKEAVKALESCGQKVMCVAPSRRTAQALGGRTIASAMGSRPIFLKGMHTEKDVYVRSKDREYIDSFGLTIGPLEANNNRANVLDLEELIEKGIVEKTSTTEGTDEDEHGRMLDEEKVRDKNERWVTMYNSFVGEGIKRIDTLVIDEAFVLNVFEFDRLINTLRLYRGNLPRIILVGDPWQTSPWVKSNEQFHTLRNGENKNEVKYIFQSSHFKRLFDRRFLDNVYELTVSKRTPCPEFARLLNRLRSATPPSSVDIHTWHTRCGRVIPNIMPSDIVWDNDGNPVLLSMHGTHKEVNAWNNITKNSTQLNWVVIDAIDSSALVEAKTMRFKFRVNLKQQIKLAIGAVVSVTNQDGVTIKGVLRLVSDDAEELHVEGIFTKEIHIITRVVENVELRDTLSGNHGDVGPMRRQFDVKILTAMTVHGAQGLTFEEPHVVYVNSFWEKQMVYTALSRATSMDRIIIAGSMAAINNNVSKSLLDFQARLDAARETRTVQGT